MRVLTLEEQLLVAGGAMISECGGRGKGKGKGGKNKGGKGKGKGGKSKGGKGKGKGSGGGCWCP